MIYTKTGSAFPVNAYIAASKTRGANERTGLSVYTARKQILNPSRSTIQPTWIDYLSRRLFISQASWSTSGEWLITGGLQSIDAYRRTGPANNPTWTRYNPSINNTGVPADLAISADGQYFVVNINGVIRIYSTQLSNNQLVQLSSIGTSSFAASGTIWPLGACAISKNGQYVAYLTNASPFLAVKIRSGSGNTATYVEMSPYVTSVNATATATTTFQLGTRVVNSITVTNQGTGYLTPPAVTIAPPSSGTTATAVANLGTGASADKVVSITITNGGSGYSSTPPAVTIAAPTGRTSPLSGGYQQGTGGQGPNQTTDEQSNRNTGALAFSPDDTYLAVCPRDGAHTEIYKFDVGAQRYVRLSSPFIGGLPGSNTTGVIPGTAGGSQSVDLSGSNGGWVTNSAVWNQQGNLLAISQNVLYSGNVNESSGPGNGGYVFGAVNVVKTYIYERINDTFTLRATIPLGMRGNFDPTGIYFIGDRGYTPGAIDNQTGVATPAPRGAEIYKRGLDLQTWSTYGVVGLDNVGTWGTLSMLINSANVNVDVPVVCKFSPTLV